MPEDLGVSPPGSLHLLTSRAVHSPLEWRILESSVGPDTQWVVAGTVHMCHSSVQTYSAGAARVKYGGWHLCTRLQYTAACLPGHPVWIHVVTSGFSQALVLCVEYTPRTLDHFLC